MTEIEIRYSRLNAIVVIETKHRAEFAVKLLSMKNISARLEDGRVVVEVKE